MNSTPVTLPSPQADSPARLPAAGGYEILRELGRGGSSVVYLARQIRADRLVALKVGVGTQSTLDREAAALARLAHPNIVALYETGQHDGQPFLALEHCAGGALSQHLAGRSLPPRAAALLVRTLAGAVQYLHAAGLLHRDLKPANVLLAADGTPRLSDFGVACARTEATAGTLHGTPSYMAPEQARGAAVDLRTDVYALGAILYECLCGRPPFRAATDLDTLRQVEAGDLAAPGQLNPSVPRDLEVICLKCLRREPAQRYGSAAELVADLDRYLAGQPILARPVGTVERVLRWTVRNPASAALLAVTVVTLVVGSTVAAFYAASQARRAEDARRSEATARAARSEALRHRDAADLSRHDLDANNRTLRAEGRELAAALGRGLLLPLGQSDIVQPRELTALLDLGNYPEPEVRFQVVEGALGTLAAATQVRRRAALILPAALGLDPENRARIERAVADRLTRKELSEAQRVELALWLPELGHLDAATVRLAVPLLLRHVANPPGIRGAHPVTVGLIALGRQLPDEAATAIVARLEAVDDASVLRQLTVALRMLAADLERPRQDELCRRAALRLAHRLTVTEELNGPDHLAHALADLAPTLDAATAARVVPSFLEALRRTREYYRMESLLKSLAPVAGHLDAASAARLLAPVFDWGARVLADLDHPPALHQVSGGLAALAAHITPEQGDRLGQALQAALAEGRTHEARSGIAGRLPELLPLLPLRARAEVLDRVAVCLGELVRATSAKNKLWGPVSAFRDLLPHLTPEQIRRTLDALAEVLPNQDGNDIPNELGVVLAAAEARGVSTAAIARLALPPLVAALQRPVPLANEFAHGLLGRCLRHLAPHLPPSQAESLLNTLLQAMQQERGTYADRNQQDLGRALLAVARHLSKESLPPLLAQIAEQVVASGPNRENRAAYAEVLLALLEQFPARQAAEQVLTLLITRLDAATLTELVRGVGEVADRLPPAEAADFLASAVALLRAGGDRITERYYRAAFLRALTQLPPRLEPELAADLAAYAATRDEDDGDLSAGTALVQLGPWLDRPAAIRAYLPALARRPDYQEPDLHAVETLVGGICFRIRVGAVAAALCPNPFPVATLAPAIVPALTPLPPGELAALLRHPLCPASARRAILDVLGDHHGRRFGDLWDFARYVAANP